MIEDAGVIELVFTHPRFADILLHTEFLNRYKEALKDNKSLLSIIESIRTNFYFINLNINSMRGHGKEGHSNSNDVIKDLEKIRGTEYIMINDPSKKGNKYRFGIIIFYEAKYAWLFYWMIKKLGLQCSHEKGFPDAWEVKWARRGKTIEDLQTGLYGGSYVIVPDDSKWWSAWTCKLEYFDQFVAEVKRLGLDHKVFIKESKW